MLTIHDPDAASKRDIRATALRVVRRARRSPDWLALDAAAARATAAGAPALAAALGRQAAAVLVAGVRRELAGVPRAVRGRVAAVATLVMGEGL